MKPSKWLSLGIQEGSTQLKKSTQGDSQNLSSVLFFNPVFALNCINVLLCLNLSSTIKEIFKEELQLVN